MSETFQLREVFNTKVVNLIANNIYNLPRGTSNSITDKWNERKSSKIYCEKMINHS